MEAHNTVNARTIGIVVALAVVVAGCGMEYVTVQGKAMVPTLQDGEKALLTRTFDRVERGDIIGFQYPRDESKRFVHRVVGLPGERVQSRSGQVFINDEPLTEGYVSDDRRTPDTWGPVTLGTDEYFVMGDNRPNSSDSRHWGPVHRQAIWAKVIDR